MERQLLPPLPVPAFELSGSCEGGLEGRAPYRRHRLRAVPNTGIGTASVLQCFGCGRLAYVGLTRGGSPEVSDVTAPATAAVLSVN